MMDRHGLIDWTIVVQTDSYAIGRCDYTGGKQIYLSRTWMRKLAWDKTPDEVIDEFDDTILHEIAHALTPRGHGHAWKQQYHDLLKEWFGHPGYRQYFTQCIWLKREKRRIARERARSRGLMRWYVSDYASGFDRYIKSFDRERGYCKPNPLRFQWPRRMSHLEA